MSASRSETDIENVSQAVAAKALGLTPRWFRQFPDAPRNADKSYSIPVVVAWWVVKKLGEQDRDSIGDADPDSELAQAKLKQIRTNTEIAELKLAQARGELWPASEVKVGVAQAFEVAKRAMLAFPARMAQQTAGLPVEDVAQILDGGVRDVLDELCEALKVEVVTEPEGVKEAV